MEQVSRRAFFRQAGAAAAVADAVSVAPIGVVNAVAGTTPDEHRELTPEEGLGSDEHLVAHLVNARTGEIVIFVGHREVTLHDRKTAARLIRATR